MSGESFLSADWHRVAALRPRLRAHARLHRHRYRGQTWHVAEDAASGRMHRYTPAAHEILGRMDGRRTVDELWRAAVDRLGDEAPPQSAVVRLLGQLHEADLLETDVASDTAELLRRRGKQARRKLAGRAGNPLAFKIPVWDPDRFLTTTLPLVRWLISPFGAVVWLAVVALGAALAAMHWNELSGNLSDRVLTPSGLLMAALVFPLLKLLHELGHGYAAKAGGGEVHELGVMLMALAPVPYVDGSASAGFRSKWARAGVALAGVGVELFVAALCAVAWSLIEAGPLRSMLFSAMLVAGVSTVVFNLNPLLRLDGYHALADILEIPNLGQRSNRLWGHWAERRLFGADVEPPPVAPGERAWLLLYAPLAFAYRLFVLFAIALFVAAEFFVVGALMAITGVLLGVVWPLLKSAGHVLRSPRLELVRGRAVGVTLAGAAAAAALLLVVPAPLRTVSEGVVWLPEEAIVRAAGNGFVAALDARPGARVAAGEVLVRQEDPELWAEAEVLRAQVAAARARLDAEQWSDRVRAEVTRREIALREAQLARAEERLAALTAHAALPGVFRAPRADDLPGRWVRRGDVLGFVLPAGEGGAKRVRAVVPQEDIQLVRERLRGVEVKLAGRVWEPLPATLAREVPAATERLPSRALAVEGGGRIAAEPGGEGENPRALRRHFQFDLLLPAGAPTDGGFGARALVRFDHGLEPLGLQWYRRGRQLVLARLRL